MPRNKAAKRSPNGMGSVREKTVVRNGKKYTSWEGRVTVGCDPNTGKQIQRSVSGKTQKEVVQKMKDLLSEIDNGTYTQPSKQTLEDWLKIWAESYLGNVKPRTREIYERDIRVHVLPAIGKLPIQSIKPENIQMFYNSLQKEKDLKPKSILNIHGVLHKAFKQAVLNGIIRSNPCDACVLPRVIRADIHPLTNDEVMLFLTKAKEDEFFYSLFLFTLLSGMREGEIMGLTWDCVDFSEGTITINKQLFRFREEKGVYRSVETKNSQSRLIVPPQIAMDALKVQKAEQECLRNAMGNHWMETNLVFTNEDGSHLTNSRIYRHFKRIANAIGRPDARFHDLRHTFAVLSLQAGDDIKTVQGNLGHATASFTLDVYGHVTTDMKKSSSQHIDKFMAPLIP